MSDSSHTSPVTKKALGQHWLDDEDTLDAMLLAADIQPDDVVLEIGPGPGALTRKLVKQAARVIAVEYDDDLARDLPKRVPAENLQVINQDILSFDLSTLPRDYKVAANIPYYLTSNLLRRLCDTPYPFAQASLLIQKEVAQRVCAQPGDMSILSVSVQLYCKASLGPLVPAELFTPPPKVDSQILQLVRRTTPLFPEADMRILFRVIKAGFAQRRKTLLNSLSSGLQLSREQTLELLNQTGIAPNTRAQALSLDQWHNVYRAFIEL